VIKNLLQQNADQHEDIIDELAKLLDTITVAAARASLIWMIGEYCDKIPLIAPDVFRKLAKSFATEEDAVKLQIINLGAKLFLKDVEVTKNIFRHVLNLAKYDLNYDIRDRGRLLRTILLNEDNQLSALPQNAKFIFLSAKPTPVMINPYKDRERFALGSLSHVLNHNAFQYQPLPDFPETPADGSLRKDFKTETYVPAPVPRITLKNENEESFYGEKGSEGSGSEEGSSTGESGSESGSETGSESGSGSSENDEKDSPTAAQPSAQISKKQQATSQNSGNIGDLFSLDNLNFSSSNNTNGLGNTTTTSTFSKPIFDLPRSTLLNFANSGGLQIEYSFSRNPSIYSSAMNSIQLFFTNKSQQPIRNIRVGKITVDAGVDVKPFTSIDILQPNSTLDSSININFNQRTNPVKFEICTETGTYTVNLTPPIGELLAPAPCTIADFDGQIKKLGGMQDASSTSISNTSNIFKQVLTNINVAPIENNVDAGSFKFAGKTLKDGLPILINLQIDSSGVANCKVYSENLLLRPQILKLFISTILK